MVRHKTPDDETMPPAKGSNVTDETRREYYKRSLKAQQEIDRAKEVLKSAVGELRAIMKGAKTAGVCTAAISTALKLRLRDKEDLIYEQRETARMLALSGVWPSIQTDMFNTLMPTDLTAEITVEVAYDNGHACGLKGENRTINPHVPGTDKYDAWDRGWLMGQGGNVEVLTPADKKSRKKHKEAVAKMEGPAEEPVKEEAPSLYED